MSIGMTSVLGALALFQLKHWIADFLLQTPTMIRDKGRYGRPLGVLHSVIHVIGSALVLFWLTSGGRIGVVVVALIAELVIHYHIDWFKEQFSHYLDMTPDQSRFWYTMGADQMLHQLTYIGMLAWLVTVS